MTQGIRDNGKPLEAFKQADLVALLKWVDEDLRNAVYAIVNSFEILPEAELYEDRETLHRTGLLAARRIEYTHQKLATLARIVSKDYAAHRAARSIRSLSREAILFAIAQDGRFGDIEPQPQLKGEDVIARIDADSMVQLLASAVLSTSARCVDGKVGLGVAHREQNGEAAITWLITADQESTAPDFQQILRASSLPDRSEGEVAIHDRYWRALAEVLGLSVEVSQVPPGLQIHATVPLVRSAQKPGRAPKRPWLNRPAVFVDKTPAAFSPIRAECVVIPTDEDIAEVLDDTQPALLVLHQIEDDEMAARRNIAISQQVDIPVLLRASHLTHEQLMRYRQYVDAILMEPCDEPTLAQYVVGLARNDRRGRRRIAELH